MLWWGLANGFMTGIAAYLIWDAINLRAALRERIGAAERFRDEYQNRVRQVSKINQQPPAMFQPPVR
jgi:hypothetical protein